MIWHFGCHYLNSCFSIEAMNAHNWNYHYPSAIFEVKCMDVMIKHQKNARPIMISASKVMIWYPRNIAFWFKKGWIVSSTKIFEIKKCLWKIRTWKDFGSTIATERDGYLLQMGFHKGYYLGPRGKSSRQHHMNAHGNYITFIDLWLHQQCIAIQLKVDSIGSTKLGNYHHQR